MNLNSKDKQTYWQERAEQRLINAENLTSDMLTNLKTTYEQAIKAIEKEINAFYGKYATETGLSREEVRKRLNPKELKDFKTQLKLYYDKVKELGGYSPDTRSYLRELSAKAYISRLEELQANIRWEVESLYRQQQLRLFEVLSKGYEETYYRANFDMQQGIGFAYSFTSLNTRAVQKAVTQKWQGSNFSDRIWSDKAKLIDTLNQTIPQGIALGKNPRVVARNISKTMETKFSNAERLARTEMNHICNSASHDAYKEAPEVLQQYKILATLDNRTSEICQANDNKVYKMSEWQEGVTAPPFHPNCYSDDTEVYTNNGWKLFKDCTDDDLYYSCNPNNFETEFLKAKGKIKQFYPFMYHIFNDKIDLLITDNHNLFFGNIEKEYYNKFQYSIKEYNTGLCPAEYFCKSYQNFSENICFFEQNFKPIFLKNNLNIKKIENTKKLVYCVELPKYHTLLVRRNGKICWCGNCRTTTVPYFEDMNTDEYTRMATDYETGKSYFVPTNMSYREWRASLTENQEKAFISNKKAREQHNADKKQLVEYRKLKNYADKHGQSELFSGMGTKLADFQTMKYQQPEVYERIKENAKIIRGEMK